MIFVKHEPVSLTKARLKVRQFLATQYPDDLEESMVAVPEEVASIEMLASNLNCGADRNFVDSTGGINLGSGASIYDD